MSEKMVASGEPPVVVEMSEVAKKFVIRRDKSVKDRVLQFRRSRSHESEFWALQGVDLKLHAGSTIGLIGPNGSGKSTLLKVIGGIIEPDQGRVCTRGRIAALLELGAGFHPDLSGRDNVYLNAAILGMSREETEERFDDIVAFSGIAQFIDTAVKFYSSGMYVRLAFSIAIHSNPDILLVDEVLAVGDEVFQQQCLDKIEEFQQEGRTIVLVTHGMGQMTSLCDRAVVLQKGDLVFDGNPYEAVDVMRRGFLADANPDVTVREEVDDHVSTGKPTIRSVRPILPPSGRFTAGGDLTVDVEFAFPEQLQQWDVTLSLVNALGMTVLTTSAHATGLVVGPLEGRNRIRFLLPDLRVGQGGYSFTSAIFGSQQRELYRQDGLGGFQALAGPESVGPVYSQVVGALEPLMD